MPRALLPLALLPLLGLSGCAYLWAAANPVRVGAEAAVPGLQAPPDAWHLEAKSSERSHISGRNNLTVQATITELALNRVRIDALLTSTEVQNTDPRNFYVNLHAGGRRTPVRRIERGEVENTPYAYTYQYRVRVQAGEVVFDDGSRATLYQDETRTGHAEEAYYSRPVTLWFEGRQVVPEGSEQILLEFRDLGIDIQLLWTLEGL